jgi:hypothetical protein
MSFTCKPIWQINLFSNVYDFQIFSTPFYFNFFSRALSLFLELVTFIFHFFVSRGCISIKFIHEREYFMQNANCEKFGPRYEVIKSSYLRIIGDEFQNLLWRNDLKIKEKYLYISMKMKEVRHEKCLCCFRFILRYLSENMCRWYQNFRLI